MDKVFIKTFGCQSNYGDSETLAGLLYNKGFQIVNDLNESISSEDVETVKEQTGASTEMARKALEETKGDLAEAILALKKE